MPENSGPQTSAAPTGSEPDGGAARPVLRAGSRYLIRLMKATTLQEIAKIFNQLLVEHEVEGKGFASELAKRLDYDRLTDLARQGGPLNDPNAVEGHDALARYLPVLGLRDDAVEDITPVADLQDALRRLGHPELPRTGVFDEATLTAYQAWRSGDGATAHVTFTRQDEPATAQAGGTE